MLPGGVVVGAAGANPPRQESIELVQRDFDGKVLWRFDHNEQIESRNGQAKEAQAKESKTIWALRQHHDWQREDFPAGYYSPDATPGVAGSNTLVLTHTNHIQPRVAPGKMLEDDRLMEISWDGKIVWEWVASDHIEEFHFDEDARKSIAAAPAGPGAFDAPELSGLCWSEPLV